MPTDKFDVPIKVTVDSSDIKKFVEDKINSEKHDDEILKRDREILTHIQHRYEEEERRFQTVDSKISSMIAVIVMIFTIQASLFTNIISNTDKISVTIV